MILRKSLPHGWWYHYRVHEEKAESLCERRFPSLNAYLRAMLERCPDEKFLVGPRSSALRFRLDAEVKEAAGHEVCTLARLGLENGRGRSAHTEVQTFMLENDAKSVATEVPLWLDEEEHELMGSFEEDGPLSGHIDVLRVEDGAVWVWDYKPGARKEKFAATQTWAYAVMLAHRTGVPLSRFRCGWFDEKDAFVFLPEKARLSSTGAPRAASSRPSGRAPRGTGRRSAR